MCQVCMRKLKELKKRDSEAKKMSPQERKQKATRSQPGFIRPELIAKVPKTEI